MADTKENNGIQNNDQFYDQLSELLYGKEESKRRSAPEFYSIFFQGGSFSFTRVTPQKKKKPDEMTSDQSETQKDKPGLNLDNDMLQAAREGRLFIVSNKEPFLRQVNVDANGKLSLSVCTKNPMAERPDLKGDEKKAWDDMRENFDKLIGGNLANRSWTRLGRWSDQRKARKVAEYFDKKIGKAKQKEARAAAKAKEADEKREREEREQKEKEKKDRAEKERKEAKERADEEFKNAQEDLREFEREAREKKKEEAEKKAVEEQEKKKSPMDKAWDLANEGKTQEAAEMMAREMEKLSQQFDKSKYLDDNAIQAGMELRQQMLRLKESGNKDLIGKLAETPEFKENKNVYQGKANLGYMGHKGQEARQKLAAQEPGKPVDKDVVLDIMASEFASSIVIRKTNGKTNDPFLKGVQKYPTSQIEGFAKAVKSGYEKTETFKGIMEGNKEELNNMFRRGYTSQRVFKEVHKDYNEMRKREKAEKEKQKQKGLKKDEEMVMKNNEEQTKKKSAPAMGK